MAAAASSTTIPLGLHQVVVTAAENECSRGHLPANMFVFGAYKAAVAATNKEPIGFSFITALSEMLHTDKKGHADLFKTLVLDKIDATHYPYLLLAAASCHDNVEMVQLVLNKAPDIAGLASIDSAPLLSIAQKNSQAKVESFLRKHFSLPVVAVSAAAPATAAAPQETLSAAEQQCLEEGAKAIRTLLSL
jgi:hypothetical protein